MKPLRRALLLLLALGLLAAAAYVYARCIEPRRLRIEMVRVQNAGLPAPVRIAVFSDVHLGNGVETEDLRRLVRTVNEQQADAVLFLGDFYENYEQYGGDPEADAAALRGITAPVRLAVWGNHDMGGGAFRIYPEVMEKGGFTLLENESFAARQLGICFVGAADTIFGRPDVAELWSEELYNILLVHEPDYALEVSGAALQLSGHSHGGQVYLPLIGAPHVPLGARHYLRGLYHKEDGGLVYVTRGIGMSILPYRFGSVPELTVIEVE